MKLISGVFKISEEFMKNPKYVSINYDRIAYLSNKMLEEGKREFIPETSSDDKNKTVVFKELIASSINYCYWYGSSNIRPNNCGSGKMYEMVNRAVDKPNYSNDSLHSIIGSLRDNLALERFPLLEERLRHISEVVTPLGYGYSSVIPDHNRLERKEYSFFEQLVKFFPGFASDLFLKRASLFFLQLHRTFGWFEDLMYHLHVPADYQVPKILRGFGAIEYEAPLDHMVNHGQLIPKGSIMECEIRAATILACRELQEQTVWNIADIDGWLWLRRKEVDTPFHLTITTDY